MCLWDRCAELNRVPLSSFLATWWGHETEWLCMSVTGLACLTLKIRVGQAVGVSFQPRHVLACRVTCFRLWTLFCPLDSLLCESGK